MDSLSVTLKKYGMPMSVYLDRHTTYKLVKTGHFYFGLTLKVIKDLYKRVRNLYPVRVHKLFLPYFWDFEINQLYQESKSFSYF